MKILITGAKGQLGTDLVEIFSADPYVELFPYNKAELDITDEAKVNEVIKRIEPDLIIHTAAYTAVDECETNWKTAFNVNSFGTYYMAKAAKKVGAAMMYISTDFIFSGEKRQPYTSADAPDPLSIYGASKLLGERFVQQLVKEFYIVRTSWVYGENGKNFVKAMLRLAENEQTFYVVEDQIGSPTYTKDLAAAIQQLIGKPYGIYHISNQGVCSWFEFAQAILKLAGYKEGLVKPISTEEYGTIAQRPAFSVLSKESIENEGITMRHWQVALEEFLDRKDGKYD
ncbi:dTDP-4-dehydrorhamnose reductase [Bacillus sp. SD088]|uniref:dTDP-4-dehydrorhamnose reductase n=1 Tax=Bacillus sp. SD088 TaxID=2782012 RepID=UPI001A95AEF2|nr:dTDP-4-dehydrorhamnose reductase [Bacillus sp. SD088]MBO0995695.1 dTDP-4-dehydrorhamnose reductase [Bacillus sp. SD088]